MVQQQEIDECLQRFFFPAVKKGLNLYVDTHHLNLPQTLKRTN